MQNQIPKPQPDYQLEQLDGEILLYHPTNTTIFYLNQTSALIWQLCDGNRTVGEIISLLSDAYPTALVELSEQVKFALNQLEQQEIIDFV